MCKTEIRVIIRFSPKNTHIPVEFSEVAPSRGQNSDVSVCVLFVFAYFMFYDIISCLEEIKTFIFSLIYLLYAASMYLLMCLKNNL